MNAKFADYEISDLVLEASTLKVAANQLAREDGISQERADLLVIGGGILAAIRELTNALNEAAHKRG